MMGMSRGAESENSKEEKGVVKTEVPTKVHWAKRKYEIYYRVSSFIYHLFSLVIFSSSFCYNLALPGSILPAGPNWGKLLILPW